MKKWIEKFFKYLKILLQRHRQAYLLESIQSIRTEELKSKYKDADFEIIFDQIQNYLTESSKILSNWP
jgi:hypothetical protein